MAPKATPGLHPKPDRTLADLALPIETFTGRLYRVHRSHHAPIFFGKTGDNRFDDALGKFGVLYASVSAEGAFAETFLEPLDIQFRTTAQFKQRKLSWLEVTQPLALVQLHDQYLRQIGADARLCTGEHVIAQSWSRSLYDHPSAPDGLLYHARHDPSQLAVAIFERAVQHLVPHPARSSLAAKANRGLLAQLLDRYDLGLI